MRFFVLAVATVSFATICLSPGVSPRATAAEVGSVEEIALWPGVAPGSESFEAEEKRTERGDSKVPNASIVNVVQPNLTVYLPTAETRNGTAIVICPGGGYAGLAIDKEGHEIARWFCKRGVVAVVLKYRNGGKQHQHPVPLNDAQRALRIVRSNAKEWQIDPDRIGIMGFSAGGHLASTAGTHYDEGDSAATEPLDRLSCKPNFMVLVYPVISMEDDITHRGSRKNLLGDSPSAEMIAELSNHKRIDSETGPTFLVHTGDDKAVPVENSWRFYDALLKHKVSAELHVFERGGHGFGMRGHDQPVGRWPGLLEAWLSDHGLLK